VVQPVKTSRWPPGGPRYGRPMRALLGLLVVAAGVTSSACGAPAAPAPPPVTVTVRAPAPAAPAAPSPVAPAAPAGESASSWTMPDLVGSNLQEAQNAVQSLTDFAIAVTTSHDATGKGRQQVLDRNWKVCSQNVAAGATITTDSKIDFGAVKLDESC
jgi:hypothetical protein